MPIETENIKIEKRKCPDCNSPAKFLFEINTDCYGLLKYFNCTVCKDTYVLRNSGDLEIAAR